MVLSLDRLRQRDLPCTKHKGSTLYDAGPSEALEV